MRTIGTDVSLDTCKDEGYLMVEFDARKKFDTEAYYRFYAYFPVCCIEESEYIDKNTLITDIDYCAVDLWELYKDDQKSIDSMIGETYKSIPNDIYTLLQLASDISSYKGLN